MKTFDLFKKENLGELILTILFIIYLIMGYKTPEPIGSMIDSLVGKIVIFIIVIYLFMYHHPVLAVLGLFVAFDLIRRSSASKNQGSMTVEESKKYAPCENNKSSQFTAFNQFPYTLEQEVIKKMAPIIKPGTSISKSSYKPLLENLHDASPIDSSD
jgi:hypothetical protein